MVVPEKMRTELQVQAPFVQAFEGGMRCGAPTQMQDLRAGVQTERLFVHPHGPDSQSACAQQ